MLAEGVFDFVRLKSFLNGVDLARLICLAFQVNLVVVILSRVPDGGQFNLVDGLSFARLRHSLRLLHGRSLSLNARSMLLWPCWDVRGMVLAVNARFELVDLRLVGALPL